MCTVWLRRRLLRRNSPTAAAASSSTIPTSRRANPPMLPTNTSSKRCTPCAITPTAKPTTGWSTIRDPKRFDTSSPCGWRNRVSSATVDLRESSMSWAFRKRGEKWGILRALRASSSPRTPILPERRRVRHAKRSYSSSFWQVACSWRSTAYLGWLRNRCGSWVRFRRGLSGTIST